ncbi:MAG: DNA-directed RNA polymerase subunit D [Halobacteriales archaeon]|nr:DNA-directed RNA polymerase subunit D [Halobacteriales archaeon]
MQVEMREVTDNKARFVVTGTDTSMVNALRRALLAEVPKLAIEDVTIYDNTSALFDEMVGHRLGLVPIPTDLNMLNYREACTCNGEGCANCTVLYTLSKEGPGTVYSGDLQPTDRKYDVKDKRIPIVKLLAGQRVMLEAQAVLGTSRQHAKWQGVTAAGYKYYPVIELLSPNCAENGACAKMCPAVFEYANGQVRLKDAEAYHFREDTLRMCKDHVRITFRRDKFIFKFETDGSLTAKEALVRAIAALKDKMKGFETGLQEGLQAEPQAKAA